MRLLFWLKSSLKPHSLAFSSHSHFCVKNYTANMHTKIVCNISFEISIFSLALKVPLNLSFELKKSVERMPTMAYIEMKAAKHRFSLMFAFVCIFGTLLDILKCK